MGRGTSFWGTCCAGLKARTLDLKLAPFRTTGLTTLLAQFCVHLLCSSSNLYRSDQAARCGLAGVSLPERITILKHLRILAGLLVLVLAAGCRAQSAGPTDLTLNRRIEVMVRSQFNIPPDVTVTLGQRQSSPINGYDSLPVTLAQGKKTQVVNFLISKDDKTLARLETFDLANDPALNIDVAGRPVRGNPNAKVTVINFDDLQCPYCARMHEELFPATLEHYKDQIRFIYKDDPLTDLHPWAMHAAVNANCLAAQSGEVYWTYVDYLHSHGEEITGPDQNLQKSYAALDRIARQEAVLGKLDSAKLDACIAKQDETQIRAEQKEADDLGIDGTPALFINGERINGALPQDQVWMAIDRALLAAGEQPPANEQLPASPQPPAGEQPPAGGQPAQKPAAAPSGE